MERIKEYTDIKREAAEYIEPRPNSSWPARGAIRVEELAASYAVIIISLHILPITYPSTASPAKRFA